MNNNTLSADDITEEQAKVEIARMQVEINALFAQIKRDRELGQKAARRTEEIMRRVNEGLARLEMRHQI